MNAIGAVTPSELSDSIFSTIFAGNRGFLRSRPADYAYGAVRHVTTDRPVLLIYSNCQADHIAKLLESIEPLTSEISVKYLFIHSLEDPGHGWDTYDENYMEG